MTHCLIKTRKKSEARTPKSEASNTIPFSYAFILPIAHILLKNIGPVSSPHLMTAKKPGLSWGAHVGIPAVSRLMAGTSKPMELVLIKLGPLKICMYLLRFYICI